MDDDLKEVGLFGCATCLGMLVFTLICMAAFAYGCVIVIDAIKS
jgi:hypothetical protein